MFIACDAVYFSSSVRSEMCQIPLLAELEKLNLSTRYKHFAPDGAEAITSESPRALTADSVASA